MADAKITGSTAVEVVPDARQWATRLRAAIIRDADRIGAEFGKRLGDAAGKTISDGVGDGIEKGTREQEREAPAKGARAGSAFAAGFKKAVEAALRNLPEITVDADTDPARLELARLRAQIEALSGLDIGVDLDAETARAQLAELQARLSRLAASDADVGVRVDAAAASAELARFSAQVERLDGQTADVDVDVDTAGARAQLDGMGASGNIASGRILGLVSAVALLGTTVGPVAAVAVGGLMAIAGAAGAAAAGVGVLVLALAPVIGAFQAVSQQQDRAGTTASQAASRSLALASAQDSLRSALRGVASAQADAAQATERAARRIDDAKQSLTRAYERAAEQAEDSARRIADAERGLADAYRDAEVAAEQSARRIGDAERAVADAQRDATLAQEDLTRARQDARRAAEDLAERVEDLARSEEDAQLGILEAKKRLDEANADPRVSDLTRRRAELAYRESLDRLDDVNTAQRRAAEDKAESDARGVEGSEQVSAALRRVEDAARAISDAQQGVRDAQQDAARQAEDSARRIADAERGVADARQDAARDAVDSARRIEDAQQAVADAQRDAADVQRRAAEQVLAAQQAVINAQRGIEQASASAGNVGGAAADKMRRKLAELSPEGRRFVKFLTDELVPQFKELSLVAQVGLLPGLQAGLSDFLSAGPLVKQVVASISTAVGDLAADAGRAFTSPFWQDFLRFARDEFPPVIATLGRIFGNLASAAAGLLIAFDPVNDLVLAGVENLSAKLRDLSTDTDPDSPIQRFVAWFLENGPTVAGAIGDIAVGVFDLVVALAPLGVSVAEGLGNLARFIGELPPPVLEAVALGVAALAASLAAVNAASAIGTAAAALGPAGPWVLGIAALGVAATVAYRNFAPFRDAVNAVFRALRDVVTSVRDDARPLLDYLGQSARGAGRSFGEFLREVGPLAALLIRTLEPVLRVIITQHLVTLIGVLKVVELALKPLTLQAQLLTAVLERFGVNVGAAGAGATDMGSAASTAADQVDRLREAQEEAADAARKLADDTLSLRDAENRYEEAIDAAEEAVKRNGATLDVNTEKGRANRSALDDIAVAANAYAQQLADNGASEQTIQRHLDTSRERLIQAGIRFGQTRDEAKKYADQVLKVPTKQRTDVSAPGATTAKKHVDDVREAHRLLASQSSTTKTAVTSNWEKIRDLAKTPVRFVINTVMGGMASAFNSLSSRIGGPTLPPVRASFAGGGVMPGYTPGRDVHEFFSPTGGFLALSGGEAVMRPEFTRAVGGKAGVDELNELARGGAPLAEMFGQRFADGGIINFIKGKAASAWDWMLDKGSDLYRAFTNPAQFLGSVTVPGAGAGFGALAAKAGSAAKSALVSKLSGLWESFKDAFSVSGVGGFPPGGGIGMGYQAQIDWVRKFLPGVAITSAYRPGSITATGNQSYHSAGRAVDLAPSMDTFNKIKQSYGSSIRELIYSPAGNAQVKNGQPHYYTGVTRDMHFNHVHWAMKDGGVVPGFAPIRYDEGGWLPTGLSTVVNKTGAPEPVLSGAQWDAIRANGSGPSIGNLTIQIPDGKVTLNGMSPADRVRFARDVHTEINNLVGGRT